MRKDPKRRTDGRCARPGCTRKLQTASRASQVDLAASLAKEPFCSARCCREYYGVVLSMPEQDERANPPSTEGRSWAGRTARQSPQSRQRSAA